MALVEKYISLFNLCTAHIGRYIGVFLNRLGYFCRFWRLVGSVLFPFCSWHLNDKHAVGFGSRLYRRGLVVGPNVTATFEVIWSLELLLMKMCSNSNKAKRSLSHISSLKYHTGPGSSRPVSTCLFASISSSLSHTIGIRTNFAH